MTQEEKEEKMKELESKRTECQIFSRVCGWLTPKHTSNPGKQAEYADRKMYKVEEEIKEE